MSMFSPNLYKSIRFAYKVNKNLLNIPHHSIHKKANRFAFNRKIDFEAAGSWILKTTWYGITTVCKSGYKHFKTTKYHEKILRSNVRINNFLIKLEKMVAGNQYVPDSPVNQAAKKTYDIATSRRMRLQSLKEKRSVPIDTTEDTNAIPNTFYVPKQQGVYPIDTGKFPQYVIRGGYIRSSKIKQDKINTNVQIQNQTPKYDTVNVPKSSAAPVFKAKTTASTSSFNESINEKIDKMMSTFKQKKVISKARIAKLKSILFTGAPQPNEMATDAQQIKTLQDIPKRKYATSPYFSALPSRVNNFIDGNGTSRSSHRLHTGSPYIPPTSITSIKHLKYRKAILKNRYKFHKKVTTRLYAYAAYSKDYETGQNDRYKL